MPRPVIKRDWWTIPELRERWGRSDEDMRRAAMNGTIRPAHYVTAELHPVSIVGGLPIANTETLVPSESQLLWPAECGARRVGAFELAYGLLRDTPTDEPGSTYWALPRPVSLSEWLQIAVVSDDNVKEAEQRAIPDAPLDQRQEATRDKIICGLMLTHYGWDPAAGKAEGLTDMLRDLKGVGVHLCFNTAKAHIREAWDRASSKLDPDERQN